MTILLYECVELEETPAKKHKLWKGCHIAAYALAAAFGLLNFYFLFVSNRSFGGQCVLDPHELRFERAPAPAAAAAAAPDDETGLRRYNETVAIVNATAVNETDTAGAGAGEDSGPLVLVLDLLGSRFQRDSYCEPALYTPVLSTIFGLVWCTLFAMCPAGGRGRRGLSEPWRILAPALIFALVFVFFTGHNFFATNSGIQALCRNFSVATNTTSCSTSMDEHMPRAGGVGGGGGAGLALGLTRAACAGAWACWACACALLLARCLVAPDFSVRRTRVAVRCDPGEKLLPLDRLSENRRKVTINTSDIYNNSRPEPGERGAGGAGADDDSLGSERSEGPSARPAPPAPRRGGNASLNGPGPQRQQPLGHDDIELTYSSHEAR